LKKWGRLRSFSLLLYLHIYVTMSFLVIEQLNDAARGLRDQVSRFKVI